MTAFLTLWLVLLFGIPGNQVIGPLGAIGSPALLVAGVCAVAWLAVLFVPSLPPLPGPQPLRWVMLAYIWYALATIALAHTRTLTPLEKSGSVREAITLVCLCGVALLVMDRLDSIERLTTLLRRWVWGGAFLATVGVAQFLTGRRLIFGLPGLDADTTRVLGQRSDFNRPYGTALHPIEYSVVLAALLPMALHFALVSEPGTRRRQAAWAATVVIALGIPLSISRSGMVAIVPALMITALGWTWRERLQGMVVGLAAIPVLWLSIPGLVGTIQSLFIGVDNDPSIQSRLDRLPRILDIVRDYLWFGLGAGTHSVEDYFLVDNEFWVTTMETGIIGVVLFFLVVLLASTMAATARFHPWATPATRRLGYAIAAGIVGTTVSIFTFDAFFYRILRGSLFLLLGAAGALWQLTRQPPSPASATGDRRPADRIAHPRNDSVDVR